MSDLLSFSYRKLFSSLPMKFLHKKQENQPQIARMKKKKSVKISVIRGSHLVPARPG